MILSIIIPVYNVEKYVEKCICSCENQDIPKEDYEVIVVNDGSPDGSLAIVERVAKEYPNIKVISQENQGLSGARNTGLEAAQGEYVWFVDSDDWIEENCLKGLTEKLVDDIDIVQLHYQFAYEDGTTKIPVQKYLDGIYSGKEITEQGGLTDPAPFSVLRSKYLKDNNFSFYRGIYHEDAEFKPRVVYYAERIGYYKPVVYNYFKRGTGSITFSFKIKNARDYMLVCNHHYEMGKNFSGKLKSGLADRICLSMNSIFLGYQSMSAEDKRLAIDELKKNRHILKYITAANKLKYRIEAYVFLINIKLGLTMYKLFK